MRYELIAGGAIIAVLIAQLILIIREHLKKHPPHVQNTNNEEDSTNRENDIR